MKKITYLENTSARKSLLNNMTALLEQNDLKKQNIQTSDSKGILDNPQTIFNSFQTDLKKIEKDENELSKFAPSLKITKKELARL